MRGARQIQDGHGIRNGNKYKRFQYDKKRLSFTINSNVEFYNRVCLLRLIFKKILHNSLIYIYVDILLFGNACENVRLKINYGRKLNSKLHH